jgi:hypothetical protein
MLLGRAPVAGIDRARDSGVVLLIVVLAMVSTFR